VIRRPADVAVPIDAYRSERGELSRAHLVIDPLAELTDRVVAPALR
jgi:hypothetical protein